MITNSASYNPDVLSCLANLSNDEVFTPPDVVNDMLDMLPDSLWKNPDATFLDPCCKTGVFLREIAKRLNTGLASLPEYAGDQNLQKRLDHIFKTQLYGIAITELTSLLSRRSVYCSKTANGKYSVTTFDSENGHIYFSDCSHTWQNGKCTFCGASESEYGSRENLESHAYQFIHNATPEEINNMKFDVIIGNPPYQLTTGGGQGATATPIYQFFFQKSIDLRPHYISMIIPSRWTTGGLHLDNFRNQILHDDRMQILHDFIDSNDCFSGVGISGGVCYFLWNRDYHNKCDIFVHNKENISEMKRSLLEKECNTYIRYNEAVNIVKKIISAKKNSIINIVSERDPYGFISSFMGSRQTSICNIKVYAKQRITYVQRSDVHYSVDTISKWKVFVSKANGAASSQAPFCVISKPFIGEPNTCCTETFLKIGSFQTENESKNVCSYLSTKFTRLLILLNKSTQNAYRQVYRFVPMQDFSDKSDIDWSQSVNNIDRQLYKKYNLTQEEISFIESMIRPMDSSSEGSENE